MSTVNADQPLCGTCRSEFVERFEIPVAAPAAVPLADSGGSSSMHSSDFVHIDEHAVEPLPVPVAPRSISLFSVLDDLVDALVVNPLNGVTHHSVSVSNAGAAAAKHFKSPAASAQFIASLRSVPLRSDADLAALSVSSCSVCMSEFECGDEAVVLDCLHPFHRDCVLPWLRSTSTCPTCRHQFPTDDAKFERRRQQS
jgi:hypothetical protein